MSIFKTYSVSILSSKMKNVFLKNLSFSSFLITLYILYFLFNVHSAFAQNNQQSITVSPSIVKLDLSKDKPEATLTYTNNSNQTLDISLSASDFNTNADYKLSFIPPTQSQNHKYALSSWVSFSQRTFTLEPDQKEDIIVFINSTELSAGSHYASILAQINSENPSSTVSIKEVLASLIFVRTNTGKEIDNASIVNFDPVRTFWSYPKSFALLFNNTGNTDVIPYGLVQIYGPFGHLVGKGILNEGSLDTFPESVRRYDINLTRLTHFYPPGFYKATINLHFGKENRILNHTTIFFSEGSIPLGTILVIAIIALIALVIKLGL